MANIFFVDDDFASELIVGNLRQRGHDVQRVADADGALRDAERISKSDLVVLDLIMPLSQEASPIPADGARSTGMLVFRELRRRRKDLPILVFTANQDPALVDVIEADPHAKYVSRWSAPGFQEFVAIVHRMLGTEPAKLMPRTFIVHGRDDKTKLEVKNYLQNTLGLPEPIILHEQPNLGRTLMEKFEDLAATTDLVFVLLTPDDPPAAPTSSDPDKRRARQNVILELGFFLGAIGRRSGRVFLLHKGPIELPSDLSGVVYVDIGGGIAGASDEIRREIEAISR
jgi:CheY-like chemotaxis protein